MGSRQLKEFITYLMKKRQDDRLFLRWCFGPQFEKSFDDFKKDFEQVTVREDEQIFEEMAKAYEKAGIK